MKRILLIVVAVIAVFFIGFWWYAFHTAAGVVFVLARVSNLKTVQIETSGVTGTLAGPLTIERLTIDHKLVHIVVDKLVLDLSPSSIFWQNVQVDTASAEHVKVDVKPSGPSDDKPIRFFPSFLQLAVDDANLSDVKIYTADGFYQNAKQVRGQLRLTAERLDVSGIAIDGPFYSATGTFALRARKPLELHVDALMKVPAPKGPPFETKVVLSGPIDKMHLGVDLTAPSTARFDGDITRGAGRWQVVGNLTSPQFLLNPWVERPPFKLTDLAVKVSASPEEIHVAGNVNSPELDELPLALDIHGQYSNRVIAITRSELRPSKSDTVIVTAARIDMTEGRPVVASTAQWTNFRWPLRDAYFSSVQGQLSMFGTFPFTLGVNADVSTTLPNVGELSGHLLAHGELSDAAIAFDEMALTALDGTIKGSARLGFTPKREWNAKVTAENVNPQLLSKELPGRLDVVATASGAGLDRNADFAITLSTLKGTLRGEPVNGRGFLSHDAKGWSAKELSVELGNSRLTANGEWREKIELAWALEVPALDRFVSTAAGSVRFTGTAHGSKTRPQIAGLLVANKLSYGDWNAESLSVAGNVDLSDRLASKVEVDGERLGYGERHVNALQVRAEGKASAHTVSIETDLDPKNTISRVSHRAEGAYANGAWLGRLFPFELTDEKGRKPTALSQPAPAAFSKQQFRVDNLCALWTDRKACGTFTWSRKEGWHATLASDQLPLSVFNDTFPSESSYQGQWQVNAEFVGRPEKPWTGSANVQVNEASLAYQPIAGAEEIVRLGTGRIEAVADASRFVTTLRIVTPGTTSIDATAKIDRNPALALLDAPLTADLRAHTADGNLLPLFFPDLDRSAGEIDIRLAASGTLDSPLIQGQFDLKNGELDLYRYNLSMRELGVAARIVDNRLTFDGKAKLGTGALAMNGDFYWRKLDPIGSLHLQGENLLVADLPEYRIVASPNVDFKIEGKRVDVRGEVVIPSAHIEPTDLRGAVQISNDVRLVGERPGESDRGFDVHSEVRVRMGDDVRLETYGLQGKLGGAVTIITGDETAIGRGELNVADGKYEAYGQKLEIAHGRLLFDASPLDNPGLDIQAARQIEERRVGVNVRGTLRAPRVSLFAEPALPQSQIVSMLLTGKPIADLSTRDTTTVGAAQDDLRLQGGSVLASQIGRRLGLEEVGVESTGLNDASLVLGKFLSPRLFVSYGISLTESINTLKLRYTLSERWRVKAEAGQNQSADVEYRIER